tara:strand:- start:1 stop:486 length:486 start_codon:yes stop_codon:yes gene_type:complete
MAITRLNNNSLTSITALPSAVAVDSKPTFLVSLTSNQSIPNTTETRIEYNNKISDTSNVYNTSTYRFTPGVAGTYWISACARMNASEDFDIYTLTIRKNGSGIARVDKRHENNESLYIALLDVANTTDYYEMYVYQNAGYALNLLGDASEFTYFQGFKLIT